LPKEYHLPVRPDLFISDLLYTTDCVIIPGLGGFVANTRSAFLNPAQHTFNPPAKKIAFNAGLRTNDGLLAHHISKELNITYGEALNRIQQFVDESFRTLNLGVAVKIEKVGVLSYDHEKHLQFEPDHSVNYLVDSFGLSAIHSPAIRREEPAGKVRKLQTVKGARDKSKRSGWRLLELIPAAAVLALLAFNPNVIHNLNSSFSSLNPMDIFPPAKIEVKHEPKEIKQEAYPETTFTTPVSNDSLEGINYDDNLNAQTDAELTGDVTASNTEVKEEKVIAAVAPTITPTSKIATASVTDQTINTGNYYVIGGCFKVYDNAVNFLATAKADGFNAEIIGINDKGMHMVSLYSGKDVTAERAEMSTIKEKFEKGAWLFSK
jgi:hypothetical protein